MICLMLAALVCVAAVAVPTADKYNPVADPASVVVCGNARFTVLTDRMLRMEWVEDGMFEDHASLAIVNRRLPVPAFKTITHGRGVEIRTGALTLTYSGEGQFTKDNLSVSFRMNGRRVTWHPGDDESGNLLGTMRTLDRFRGFGAMREAGGSLEKGILSRDGWAIVDESSRHLLVQDDSEWGEWVSERPSGERQDWYIFAYGHDYKAALADYVKVSGRVPMPPRYAFGYWWSRYWAYTDAEFMQIATDLRSHEVPSDVFIIDMDWHLTWKQMQERLGNDEFGQRRGWTGYTWNHDLIPDPDGLLHDLHALDFKTSLNLHPASGIRPYESCYHAFVEDYLSRTDDYDGPEGFVYGADGYVFKGNTDASGVPGHSAPVPYRMDQQAWADAYFETVIHPIQRQGVDFWWLDWQQWMESKYVQGLSNTFWINYCFWNDQMRGGVGGSGADADNPTASPRPMIYHRWGGLGSHRYQLGFSGDTYDEWATLRDLPEFTASSSNVCYGYWGHDIGGHMQKVKGPVNAEKYTRWMQYGVFTPIFKTHSTSSSFLERRIWMFPEHYDYLKAAIELRYALSPYIYNAARNCYDSGVGLCRPLYYEYPEDARAYSWKEEFLFGDDILATVLCEPAGEDGRTRREMWFPSGCDWYDMARHCMCRGGSTQTLYYTIDQNPWYVRASAVIPLAKAGIQNLQSPASSYRLLVVPGGKDFTFDLYEDDGTSQGYISGKYATTRITKTRRSGRTLMEISAREGSFDGAPSERDFEIILEGRSSTPSRVLLNGSPLPASSIRVTGTAVILTLPSAPVSTPLTVEIG